VTAVRAVKDLFDLTGRVAIVTGGAGLYGRHICEALAELGATIVVASRDLSECTSTADELVERGFIASARALDLADERSVQRLCDEVMAEAGSIDVLVNNAVHRSGGSIETATADDWSATSDVNSRGLFLMCKHTGAHMAARGHGSIVNIGSIYGVVGADFGIYEGTGMTSPISYAFDKAGMVGLTRYLASWYGRQGIRVNCLSPGGLRTPDQDPTFVESYERRVPIGRMAGPEDIKGPVAFLASDASAYVTGVNLLVDGGWTMI